MPPKALPDWYKGSDKVTGVPPYTCDYEGASEADLPQASVAEFSDESAALADAGADASA